MIFSFNLSWVIDCTDKRVQVLDHRKRHACCSQIIVVENQYFFKAIIDN